MKKRTVLSMILAAALLGTLLMGCGTAAESSKEEAAVQEETKEEEGQTGLANPWSDVASAEEAAKGAGIDSFEIAEDLGLDLGENFDRTFRCMEGIAEAWIEYPASALTLRKGTSAEDGDISGDYNQYKKEWTQEIDGVEVKCFGNEDDAAMKAIWSVDGMFYSMNAQGLGGDENFGLSAERLTSLLANFH